MYDFPVKIEDTNAVDVTYGVGAISEWDQEYQRHTVIRPDADSIDCSRCVILPGSELDTEEISLGCVFPTRPIIARFDTDGGIPAIGDSLGTQTDSWELLTGNTGFICLGVVDETEGLCLVRPFASSGGRLITDTIDCGELVIDVSSGYITLDVIPDEFGSYPKIRSSYGYAHFPDENMTWNTTGNRNPYLSYGATAILLDEDSAEMGGADWTSYILGNPPGGILPEGLDLTYIIRAQEFARLERGGGQPIHPSLIGTEIRKVMYRIASNGDPVEMTIGSQFNIQWHV
jgi:hypothetical protein